MSNKSRTHNSIRNTVFGISTHLLTALFSFVSRTVFVRILGEHYLGVSGLFANIFTMLSLSDLGIYTVMVFSLYKPLADDDRERLSALMQFYQKLYRLLALIVFGLGLLCIPLLPFMIKGSILPYEEILLYYILMLAQTAASYLAISRSTLLRADQQVHLVQVISSATTFALQLSQIGILLLTHNYALYLVLHIVTTLLSNLIISTIAGRKYPYIKEKKKLEDPSIKREIVSNIKSTFLYKVGNVLLNSTDNILISVIVGTVFVGYYSNYVTVFNMVNSFIMIFIQGILASVGNYYASKSPSQNYSLFRTLQMGFYGLAALCTSCYICGMNDFIAIWLGEEFVLGGGFVFALAINRFVFCAIHPLWMTRESAGLFYSTRYLMLFAAAINLGLSILLGIFWGTGGIILATALSYLLTVFWYEPLQLCKKVFEVPYRTYWFYSLRLFVAIAPIFVTAVFLKQWVTGNFFILLLKFFICAVVTLISYLLFLGRTPEFKRVLRIFSGFSKKIFRGRKV